MIMLNKSCPFIQFSTNFPVAETVTLCLTENSTNGMHIDLQFYSSQYYTKEDLGYIDIAGKESVIFKITPLENAYPAVLLQRGAGPHVGAFKYALCKGEPWVMSGEAVEQDCEFVNIKDEITEANNNEYSIYVPTDGALTGQPTAPVDYYVTLMVNQEAEESDAVQNLMFEYAYVEMVKTNYLNPIAVQPDAATTYFGNSNFSFQIYDVVVENA